MITIRTVDLKEFVRLNGTSVRFSGHLSAHTYILQSINNRRINWCVNTYPCRCERHVNLQVSQMQMLMFACSHHSGNGSEDSGGGDERAHHFCTYVNNKRVSSTQDQVVFSTQTQTISCLFYG